MNEKFSITIDCPCSENFNNFVPTDKGSYCSSCKKTVIDFTKLNDPEIQNYFNNEKKKTCGLFLESQLKTYSSINLLNKPKTNRLATGVFGFSLFSILSFSNGYSQENIKGNETVKIEKDTEEQNSDSSDVNNKHKIKGIVSDEVGPLPGANVVLKGKMIGTQTDIDGKFIFPERLEIGDILVVSFIGFKVQEIEVIKEGSNVKMNYEIILKTDGVIMMGEVNTTTIYKSKRTFFQKMKSLFTNE